MFNFMKKDFKIVQKFPVLIAISALIIVAGIVMMIVSGLNIGIDYEGGAKVEIELAGDYAENSEFKAGFEKEFTDFINSNGYAVADKMQVSSEIPEFYNTLVFSCNFFFGVVYIVCYT